MASRIRAINAMRPRIKLGKTVQKAELVRYIADSTNLSEGQIDLVIKEMRDAIIFFNQAGRSVKVDGLGTYRPKVNLDGSMGIQYRIEAAIQKALNVPGIFGGDILNRANFGKTGDELVTAWNELHPEDPAV